MTGDRMRAGLSGLASHMQALAVEQMGFHVQLDQRFWNPVCRALELAAREQVEAKRQTDEAGGRGEAAFAGFSMAVIEECEALGIQARSEAKLYRLVTEAAKAGLASLIPACVAGD
jgi:hypothetical protein